VLGETRTEWRTRFGIVTVTVVIPQHNNATVILPDAVETRSGKVIAKGQQDAQGMTTFIVGPGRHTFELTMLEL
jgi:hypothetical protein